MKNYLVVVALLVCAFANAQEWETNFNTAKEKATELNQNIVLVFSGSDWCAPCIKLEKNIWQSQEFKSYAKANCVLLRADFPRKKSNRLSEEQTVQNAKLAETYNKTGAFPLVVILDATGKVLGETGYKNIPPSEYVGLLKAFKS